MVPFGEVVADPGPNGAFRLEDHVLPQAGINRLTEDALGVPLGVDVCVVKEIDPQVHSRAGQLPNRLLCFEASDPHTAQSDFGYFQRSISQSDFFMLKFLLNPICYRRKAIVS